jgi:hypothetical protein
MATARNDDRIAIYDGQSLLGFVAQFSARTFFAYDANGKRLGTFPTRQRAIEAAALSCEPAQ